MRWYETTKLKFVKNKYLMNGDLDIPHKVENNNTKK